MSVNEVLYENGSTVLKELGEAHRDDYSLRSGPLYVEFSDVQWQDYVLLLFPRYDGAYMSVRHNADEDSISEELRDLLLDIRH